MAEKHSNVYMYHIFFNHSSVDGHLGYSHVLAVANSQAAEGPICFVKRHKLHLEVVFEPCFLELLRGRAWGPSPPTQVIQLNSKVQFEIKVLNNTSMCNLR